MTTGKKKWAIVGTVLVLVAGLWWYANPIRLNQKAVVEGFTIKIPFGWVARTFGLQPEPTEFVGMRRAFLPWKSTRSWATAMIGRGTPGEPYTLESAGRERALEVAAFAKNGSYSNPKVFEVTSGKYPSLCAEVTLRGDPKAPGIEKLDCLIVGTSLRASFVSPKGVDVDAAKILSSLE